MPRKAQDSWAVVRGPRDRAGIPAVRELSKSDAKSAVKDRRSRPGATGRADWRIERDSKLTERTRGAKTMTESTRVLKAREARKRSADRRRRGG
jgi:hypothetical protein